MDVLCGFNNLMLTERNTRGKLCDGVTNFVNERVSDFGDEFRQ